jgi:hypothetical protein
LAVSELVALRGQFVSEVGERIGFSVAFCVEGGERGGSEVRAVEADDADLDAQAGGLVEECGEVGKGGLDTVPDVDGRDEAETDDHLSGDSIAVGDLL